MWEGKAEALNGNIVPPIYLMATGGEEEASGKAFGKPSSKGDFQS